jgi:hypothetical protein
VSKKSCPLGEDCDLTIAWMKGAEDARDKAKARIEALTEQLEAARLDAEEAEAYSVWLEAKLGKTEDFVRRVIRYAGNNGDDFLADKGREALLELRGENDE